MAKEKSGKLFRLRGPLYVGGELVAEAWSEWSDEDIRAAHAAACEREGVKAGDIVKDLRVRGALEDVKGV